MSALELVFDYFEDHAQAAAQISQRRPVAFGVFCFALGALSLFVAQGLSGRLFPLSFSWPSLGLMILWELVAGFVLAAILHLILDLGGVRGSGSGLFVHLGMANLAWAVAVPLILILKLLVPRSGLAVTTAFLAVGLLSVSLKARGIQDNYRITSAKAWVTLGLPYLLMLAAGLLAMGLAAGILFLQVMKAFD